MKKSDKITKGLKSQDSFWQIQNETEMTTQYYGDYEQESLI